MHTKDNQTRLIFYSIWMFSLLLQAYFTGLGEDEAYYWMYSTDLAWGYFDHPPVIALLIKIGYSIIPNELGVRLFPVILSTLSLFFIEKIIEPKKPVIFYMLATSVGILHFIGFFAIPDSPLIFSFTVFLWLYKRFLNDDSFINALLLGVVAAFMSLSKYHGLIIIAIIVLSNFKLLTNKYFWVAAITGVGLCLPHFLWHVNNGFPSVTFHFLERSKEGYLLSGTLEYLGTQLFVLGPITGIIFLIANYKQTATTPFERSLKFLFWGGYFFFFLMTFNGRVEAHWTLFAVVPGLYFGYKYVVSLKPGSKLLPYTFYISVSLIVLARLFLAIDFNAIGLPAFAEANHAYQHKDNMLAIKEKANGRPVGVMNSYQKASLYAFYSKSEGFSMNNAWGRKNQFDIWNVDDKYRGQNIMVLANNDGMKFDLIGTKPNPTKFVYIDNYQSFSNVRIESENVLEKAKPNEAFIVKVTLRDVLNRDVNFEANEDYPVSLYYHFFKGKKMIKSEKVLDIKNGSIGEEFEFQVEVPDDSGELGLFFSLKSGWLPNTNNSRRYGIEVSPNE